jgi:hypothetical protein
MTSFAWHFMTLYILWRHMALVIWRHTKIWRHSYIRLPLILAGFDLKTMYKKAPISASRDDSTHPCYHRIKNKFVFKFSIFILHWHHFFNFYKIFSTFFIFRLTPSSAAAMGLADSGAAALLGLPPPHPLSPTYLSALHHHTSPNHSLRLGDRLPSHQVSRSSEGSWGFYIHMYVHMCMVYLIFSCDNKEK